MPTFPFTSGKRGAIFLGVEANMTQTATATIATYIVNGDAGHLEGWTVATHRSEA